MSKLHLSLCATARRASVALLVLCSGLGAAILQADDTPKLAANPVAVASDSVALIPRKVLFGAPKNLRPRLSPDGKHIMYMAPYEGELQIWLQAVGEARSKPITVNSQLGLRQNHAFYWAPNSEQILVLKDNNGDGVSHVYTVSLADGTAKDLTPIDGVGAQLFKMEPQFPDSVLVGLNDGGTPLRNVYRIDLRTGSRELVFKNDIYALALKADHEFTVRIAITMNQQGEVVLLHRANAEAPWQELTRFPSNDAVSLLTRQLGNGPDNDMDILFSGDNQTVYVPSSVGGNAVQALAFDTETGEREVLFGDPAADLSDITLSPQTEQPQAVALNRARREWTVLDPALQKDFAALSALNSGDLLIVDRDAGDARWLVAYVQDRGPVAYYLYDRKTTTGSLLFYNDPALATAPLVEMKPVTYPARDGLTIPGYLLMPAGLAASQLPLVVLPHGGPMGRVNWGFNADAQWLANRGYVVLLPNFRASTGYGRAFAAAGNREWGGKIQDDISDGVHWLIDQGIADPQRICIMGSSFGGYSALMGIVKEPDLYACSIAAVPPTDLVKFRATLAPFMATSGSFIDDYMGHPVRDAERLQAHSPAYFIDSITTPVLMVNGARDDRVPRDLVLQFRDKLKAAGREVEHVEFEDEGHGFAREENRFTYYGLAEQFLAKHIGGRSE